MTQYILKSALVAEIERLKDKFSGYPTCTNYDYGVKDGRLVGYDEVLHIIDTLEVKEVDLEKKEIIDKACWWLNNNRLGVIDDDYIKEFRKAINN